MDAEAVAPGAQQRSSWVGSRTNANPPLPAPSGAKAEKAAAPSALTRGGRQQQDKGRKKRSNRLVAVTGARQAVSIFLRLSAPQGLPDPPHVLQAPRAKKPYRA